MNLIPVMNLFVTLIPFLLLAAAFYHVGVIPTSLPSQTDETSDVADNTRSVTVNVVIEPDRIELSAASAVLDEETLAGLSVSIPKTDKGFDLKQLGKALYAIKSKYDQSDTVVVLPSERVKYHQVVEILDATREFKTKGSTGDQGVPLFPVVVMSRKV